MADAKKLLIVTQAVDPRDSALGFFCEWIAEIAADPRVASVDVWCLREGAWNEKPRNVTIHVLPKTGRVFAFLSRLVRSRFDAVVVHMSPVWIVLGGWWWRLTGQRVVLWYTHGTGSAMLRAAMGFADQVLTATKDAFPIPSEKVSAIGHGISPSFFAVPRDARTGGCAILGSGRITPRKRVIETIRFFAEIATRRQDAHLTWIGEAVTESDRAYLARVNDEIARLGLQGRVTLNGKVAFAELPPLYAASDLLLHLSATGSLDKVVIEALASGCPAFSTNPATNEAIPSAYWPGPLDASAAEEAIRHAERGITPDERRSIAERFSLRTLITKIVGVSFPAAVASSSGTTERVLWWLGVPVLTFCSVFVPYWAWQYFHGVTPFWRITIFEGQLFDVSWYLPMIGAAMSGLEYGGYLHWFGPIIRALHLALPDATVPDIWFITRWISTTAMVWVGAWCFRAWIGLERRTSRLFSVAFWFSLILVLGMRPGVYSWYVPVCFAGLVGAWFVLRSLERSDVPRAILWSFFALATNWIYFWFFSYVVIWLASIWAAWVHKRSPRVLIGLFAAGAVVSPMVAVAIARWLPGAGLESTLDTYGRLGFAFTRMPFLSNSFIVIFCWMALLAAMPRLFRLSAAHLKTLVGLEWAWIALLFTWLSTLFMGFFFQNDHFRTPVVLLAWVSLAFVWAAFRDGAERDVPSSTRFSSWPVALVALPLVVSLVFLYRIIIPGYYVFHGEHLNVLHVSHWMTVALAAGWMLWARRAGRRFHATKMLAAILVLSAIAGVTASVVIHRVELTKLLNSLPGRPLIAWIKTHVPEHDAVCTDPQTAAFLGIHTARLTHPLAMTRYLPLGNAEDLNILLQIASAYDVQGAGEMKGFKRFVRQDRGNACVQFAKQVGVLRALGVSEPKIQEWLGCPTAQIDAELAALQRAIEARTLDDAAFAKACPWVVVTESKQPYWQLPKTYVSTTLPDSTTIWYSP